MCIRDSPYICTFIIALCTSCSGSKFIPEDKYLLDEVRIVSETKEVKPSLFNSYIRQNHKDVYKRQDMERAQRNTPYNNKFFFILSVLNYNTLITI